MDTASSQNNELLTSRMLISLARLIEGAEDVSLLPLVGTYAMPKQPDYDEYVTHFNFTMLTGMHDCFETLLLSGYIKDNEYSCSLVDGNSFKQGMRHIVEAALPPAAAVVKFDVTVEVAVVVEVWLRWRTPPCRLEGVGFVHNQVADSSKVKANWNNLRFRSHSEMRIAVALDATGVLFLPNCMGRLSTPEGRKNLECDFLVCYEGRWGILEVDGEPYHPASRAAEDHERDRLFRAYGIRVVERFDARECFENAKGVVQRFLEILKRA